MKSYNFLITLVVMNWTIAVGNNSLVFNEDVISNTYHDKEFYTYDEIRDEFITLVNAYPLITKLDTIGYSILGKAIWMLRISGAEDTATRQHFFISGATHGNEKIGTETAMRIAQYLLEKYASDNTIKEIVDRSQILLVPIVNPDGFIKHSRYLNSGADPNRAFGWQLDYDGASNISYPFEYPEMQAYRDVLMQAPWYASFDYHTGMVGLLKPWMCSSNSLPDNDAYDKLKNVYNLSSDTRANQGESVDSPYGKCGTMAFLPELHSSQSSQAPDDLEETTEKNLQSFLDVVEEMQKGVCGKVIDSKMKTPLNARIQVKNVGTSVYTDYKSGAFYKYIPSPSGTYEVTAFSNGYETKTITVDAVSDGFATADFELVYNPDLKYGAISLDAIRVSNDLSYSEFSTCLEMHDDNGIPIECSGIDKAFINLDMGPITIITNQNGDDLTVYATNNDNYTVSVAYDIDNIDSSDHKLGEGQGTASFDLEDIDLDSARFVQISCTSGSPSIDAVEAEPRDLITKSEYIIVSMNNSEKETFRLVSSQGKIEAVLQAYIPQGKFSIEMYDLKGKKMSILAKGNAAKSSIQSFYFNKHDNNGLQFAPGTYIFYLNCSGKNKAILSPIF